MFKLCLKAKHACPILTALLKPASLNINPIKIPKISVGIYVIPLINLVNLGRPNVEPNEYELFQITISVQFVCGKIDLFIFIHLFKF